jgi:predicted glycosyltransferase
VNELRYEEKNENNQKSTSFICSILTMHTQNESPIYNILMYSHDTYGLGHIRRTMAIANHLRDANTNVLILTGSPIAGRFQFSQQVDFVRIPGMIKECSQSLNSDVVTRQLSHSH